MVSLNDYSNEINHKYDSLNKLDCFNKKLLYLIQHNLKHSSLADQSTILQIYKARSIINDFLDNKKNQDNQFPYRGNYELLLSHLRNESLI